MSLPEIRVTKDEMRARVAFFKDLKGFDTGLTDSEYPSAYRMLYNALGFQPPKGKGGSEVESPVGADASANSAIKISEGFNITVLPAAIAETNGPKVKFNGKFHGAMIKTTPLGSYLI